MFFSDWCAMLRVVVVLETAGTFTVLPKSDRPLDAARDVTGNPDDST
jgi:hypothetical protein